MKKEIEVVGALIFEKDKFLICQRPKNKSQALLWEFVGGKVEIGETKQDALIRECKEELDVDISVGKQFCSLSYEYPESLVHLTVFLAKILGNAPKKIEHNDIKWITSSEIELYDFCPADTPILKLIKENY